jgi:protein-S-isoprenylcysteine O-methyltransferase Ste14
MVRLLFAAAVALFVLHLPIRATGLGAAMRRWAGFSFVAALVPSLVIGLFFPGGFGATFAAHPIATSFGLLVAVGLAYAAYRTRKWLLDDPKKKQARLPEKTPIERSRRQQDLFAWISETRPPEDPQP